MPNDAPEIIAVSAVGPSTTKADYSSYGLHAVDISAPGGWFRDFFGTAAFQTPGNLVLSSYPLQAAIEQEFADPGGEPVDEFSIRYCDENGVCGFYTYLQGTSMAAPHVTGVAALVVEAHGRSAAHGGRALAPQAVERILVNSATDQPCPAGGVEDYTDEGRTADWNAVCQGTTDDNGLYGEGIVDAAAAVRGH
jgi:subtilisin family serine protease